MFFLCPVLQYDARCYHRAAADDAHNVHGPQTPHRQGTPKEKTRLADNKFGLFQNGLNEAKELNEVGTKKKKKKKKNL